MRLHDDPTGSSAHDTGDVDDASRDRSDDSLASSPHQDRSTNEESDDFVVLADSALSGTPNFWSGGARRAERLDVLSERVASPSTAASAQALITEADELRRQAAERHPIMFATDFSEAIRAFHPYEQLPKTVFECEDAGLAWQSAADQYRAAIDVARRVGLPAGDIERLDAAAAHCDAQTARSAVKASLLAAVTHFKRYSYGFTHGNLKALGTVLVQLRAALEHAEGSALHALPLDSAPIVGVDAELDAMADHVRRLSIDAAQGSQPTWPESRKQAVSELEYVLSALPLVLRGEPNAPKLHVALRSALETPMAYASGLHVAAEARESDPSRSLESLTDTFDSWYQTARAYDDVLHTFDESTASWPGSARTAPQVRQLRAAHDASRNVALGRMKDALLDLFSTMSATMPGPQHGEDADPSVGMGAVTAAEILIGADLLWHCRTLRGKLDESPFLREAADIDAGRLATPFASLEQCLAALLARDADPLDTANQIRQAAAAAERAAPAYGRTLAPAFREFSALCAMQRRQLVNSGFQQIHSDAIGFTVRESAALMPALQCMYALRQSLPFVGFDASPEDDAATHPAPPADEALIASTHDAVQRVEAHLAQMPAPPADAPERMVENHAAVQFNLKALATAMRTIATLITCCGEARRAIEGGPTADCTAKLRRLADDLRRVGEGADEVLALGRTRRLTQGETGERTQRTLQFSRRVERTAKCIRYTLGALADLSHGYQRVQDMSRAPTLDLDRFQQIAERLTADLTTAEKDIDATRSQLIRDVGTRHPSDDAAEMAAWDIKEIRSFTGRLEWRYAADFDAAKRQWLRATVGALSARIENPAGTVPPSAQPLLDRIDQHLAAGTKILTIAARHTKDTSRLRHAFEENNDIRGAVQACRARLAARATGSSSGTRKGKQASGKAKRR